MRHILIAFWYFFNCFRHFADLFRSAKNMGNGNNDFTMKDLNGTLSRFTAFLQNLATQATALSDANAATISSLNTVWVAIYNLARGQNTRTPYTIQYMHMMRNIITGQLRTFIQEMQAPGEYTPAQKTRLGITPKLLGANGARIRRPAPVPHTGPTIVVEAGDNCQLILRYRNTLNNFTSKAKPKGCVGCRVDWTADNGASGSAEFSKSPCYLNFPLRLSGHRVGIVCRWNRGNNRYSPTGNVVMAVIPDAGIPAPGQTVAALTGQGAGGGGPLLLSGS
jgi:hypothetical protein